MEAIAGEEKVYRSHDSVEEYEHQLPVEFLNTLCPSSVPPHRLHLKKHSIIIMLLRNLDPVNGHCNGPRYAIEHLHDHIIDATIACGPDFGKRISIPRIPMTPSDNIFLLSHEKKTIPCSTCLRYNSQQSSGANSRTDRHLS